MLQSTTMKVTGMNSAHAIRAVSDALVAVQGVADIGVNGDQDPGTVQVKFDGGKTNEQAIREAVQRAGYSAE